MDVKQKVKKREAVRAHETVKAEVDVLTVSTVSVDAK